MTKLVPLSETYREKTVPRIAAFFAFHASLSGKPCAASEQRLAASEQTLFEWTGEDHELCVIMDGNVDAGFLHVGYRGGNVAWIEDIYVDAEKRGRGIASRAIAEAEKNIRARKRYTAVCVDAMPGNAAAPAPYRRLGYDILSMITVRKELNAHEKNRTVRLLGHDFLY